MESPSHAGRPAELHAVGYTAAQARVAKYAAMTPPVACEGPLACPEVGQGWYCVRVYKNTKSHQRAKDDYWFGPSLTRQGRHCVCDTPAKVRDQGGHMEDKRPRRPRRDLSSSSSELSRPAAKKVNRKVSVTYLTSYIFDLPVPVTR